MVCFPSSRNYATSVHLYSLSPFELLLVADIALYLAGVAWFMRGMRRREGRSVERPLVSIVVAARNEEQRIGACLGQLTSQQYPHYEIIVVDDGSTDATAALVAEIARQDDRLSLLQRSEGGSKKAALALGIAQSRGEVIATTDADCLMGSEWLDAMLSYLESDVGMVIGFSQIGSPHESLGARGSYEAIDFLNLMACIWGSSGQAHPMAASGQNLVFRRSAYEQVQGYGKVMHRASGDDVLLMQMVRSETDWRIAFACDDAAHTQHPVAPSWQGLFNQRARWASNATLMLRLDPLFFSYMVITYLLSWSVVLTPFIALVGWVHPVLLAGVIACKWGAEGLFFRRAQELVKRPALVRYWPLWALIQPVHVALVGGLGVVGMFSWKGQRHRWGRSRVSVR